jgi:hypothetical protein
MLLLNDFLPLATTKSGSARGLDAEWILKHSDVSEQTLEAIKSPEHRPFQSAH